MKSISKKITSLLAVFLALSLAGNVGAVSLNPGDILLADEFASAIFRIDPGTGAQTVVSSGGFVVRPRDVALDANGNIFVSDSLTDAVIRVDPITGAQTIVSSGGFSDLPGIAVEANGDILVTEVNIGKIVRIDPVTGTQTVVSSGGNPFGITLEANGNILVTDLALGYGSGQEIIRIDPATGARTTVSSGGLFIDILGIAIEDNGQILVADNVARAIFRVDPVTGAQTVVSSGGLFSFPWRLAVEANGDILVSDRAAKAIFRVDPVTGAQTVVSSGGSFALPEGTAVVPPPSVLQVTIDIKPGRFPNRINPKSRGGIPVAILTTDTFDATTVDPTTVRFGATGTEAAPVQSALEDVDGDGDTDLILHFNTQGTGIVCGDTSASLTGETFGGQMIEGSDSIKTVGCK